MEGLATSMCELDGRRIIGAKSATRSQLVQGAVEHKCAQIATDDRIPVWLGARSPSDADGSSGAAHVLNDKGLSQAILHLARDQPRQDVRRTPGRKGHDYGDWMRGIAMRERPLAEQARARRRSRNPKDVTPAKHVSSSKCAVTVLEVSSPRHRSL